MNMRQAVCALLITVVPAAAWAGEAGTGSLAGWVAPSVGTAPQTGIVVIFDAARSPAPGGNYLRVPEKTARLDTKGAFMVDIPEGSYYVGAILRSASDAVGPPGTHDTMVTALDERGLPRKWDVTAGVVAPVGALSQVMPVGGGHAARMKNVGFEGHVLDDLGRPVAGALVFAWRKTDTSGSPLFVSEKSAGDGHYLLRVDQHGDYFVIARQSGQGRLSFPADGAALGGASGTVVHVGGDVVVPGKNVTINHSGS